MLASEGGEAASQWADRLLDITRVALSPDPRLRGHYHGTEVCLSALYYAGRYDELIGLVRGDKLGSYQQWAVRLVEQDDA